MSERAVADHAEENERRKENGESALHGYAERTGQRKADIEEGTTLTDLLSDLMHAEGLASFDRASLSAREHFEAERYDTGPKADAPIAEGHPGEA